MFLSYPILMWFILRSHTLTSALISIDNVHFSYEVFTDFTKSAFVIHFFAFFEYQAMVYIKSSLTNLTLYAVSSLLCRSIYHHYLHFERVFFYFLWLPLKFLIRFNKIYIINRTSKKYAGKIKIVPLKKYFIVVW